MRKILLLFLPILLILFPVVSAETTIDIAEIEDKINSIAHYAEEYEVGNINYLQLNVHGHKIRADLNLMLGGGIGPDEWGRIPVENVEMAFGPPTDYTNWVWVENKQMDKRFDEEMPWWEKIIFDGRKVQIIFHASPHTIEGEGGEIFKYYSVDLNVKFKERFQFDIDAILDEVTSLITEYDLTRTRKVGEVLVRKMLEYERLIRNYIQDNVENCVEIVGGFFKPEERWPEQTMMRWKFSLYPGSDFDVEANFDMCEECEWHWVYMGFWVEGRGPVQIFKSPELHLGKLDQQIDEEYYWGLTIDELNQELKNTVFEIRDEAENFDKTRSEDFPKKFFFNRFKIEQINRILDGKYNDVHRFDQSVARRIEAGEVEGPGGCENFEGCRRYCEKRGNMEECRKFTYNLRVEFIEDMFREYDIRITPTEQIEWEKRLFENLEVYQDSWCRHVDDFQCADDEGCVDGNCVLALGGDETCDNNEDDDGDNVVDCQDPDCWEERHCGKLCEDTCNRDGGCWQTTHELCRSVCGECWECGGGEECHSICEIECNPCHNSEEVRGACDDCWACEDESYGGCYVSCKPCDECNKRRMGIINDIFERARAGEIRTPGGCMSEEECNDYCNLQQEGECWDQLREIGLHSEEFDCSGECKECSVCNYDQGNFKCNEKQHFDREKGYCICDEGFYDCDGNWENGCETDLPCGKGRCFEECEECDTCWGEMEGMNCGQGFEECVLECSRSFPPDCLGCAESCVISCEEKRSTCESGCDNFCLGCQKCRNPDMPTYICDGVEQLEPCEPEYMCNGVKQKKPCEIYICNGIEYTKPCDEINVTNITCGENQILIENECACNEGFKDCDNDGNCESTRSCGLEICDDMEDNNNNSLIDCQDPNCERQVCAYEEGEELLCISKKCIPPEEEVPPEEPEPICGDHICEGNESKETCPEDCVVCEVYEPPECPNGKIVWKGKDKFGCHLPPICVVTDKTCESDEDCPQPKCGVSQCVEDKCKVTELVTDCEEGCKEGKTKKRKCKDGSEITTAICAANQWTETGYDCPEVPPHPPEEECLPIPISCWCPDGTSCPQLTDEKGCGYWGECPEEEEVPEEEIPEEEEVPEEEIPEEEEVPEEEPEEPPEEEIAPEVEEEEQEVSGDCVLASDCGGPQDVCSNGNCVTLPIPIEEEAPPEEPIEVVPEPEPEAPPEEPELPPEVPPEAPPEQPPEQPPEAPPEQGPPTGDIVARLSDFVTGLFTGLFTEGDFPCEEECRPCEECNMRVDEFMRKIEAGEIQGPGGCENRMSCEQYCWNWENEEECENFFSDYGLETIHCWDEFCRGSCNTCRYEAGEFECNENQHFDSEDSSCWCDEGWFECDGDWENGCESFGECGGCESKADCAEDRCAPWGNVIQQFDCVKGEEWVHDKGAVRFQGSCRTFPTKRMEGWVHFDMWGDPFEELHPIREEIEMEMGEEWCEWQLENKIKERIEIQNSLTEEFLTWFFEEYVPSSPSEWEKHIGGIFDSYWRIVDNSMKTSELLLCSGEDKLPEEYEPIEVSYDTEFGSVRVWEAETTTDFFGKRARIISPYMQIWILPTKEFIKKEFQAGMKGGYMPGPEGKQKPEIPPSEQEKMRRDPKFMGIINSISEKYGGEAKIIFNIVDGEELVFNALITINDEVLIKMEPMETYEGDYDAKITFEFDFFYDMILTSEREMKGGHVEYPPWESRPAFGDMFKGMVDGMRMWFMIQGGIASGQIRAEPGDALQDGLMLMQFMFERGPPDEKKGPPEGGTGEGGGEGTGGGEEGQGQGGPGLLGPPEK